MISGLNHHVRSLKEEINFLLNREARLWNQRSRVLWLKYGDNNTNIFIAMQLEDTNKIRLKEYRIRRMCDKTNPRILHQPYLGTIIISSPP